jgi:hypothetical protein
MNITFKTKIRYNGKDFSSVDELPPEIRAIYERALANRPNKLMSTGTKVLTQLLVNGHEVESTKELSEDGQKLYADAMQLLKDGGTSDLGTTPAQSATRPLPVASMMAVMTPVSAPIEAGWLTANQKKLVVIVGGMILVAAVIIALRTL